jgi:hypothetical protein
MKATVIVISHDELDSIKEDRYFGETLVQAINDGKKNIEAVDNRYRKLAVGVGVNFGDVDVPLSIFPNEEGILALANEMLDGWGWKIVRDE